MWRFISKDQRKNTIIGDEWMTIRVRKQEHQNKTIKPMENSKQYKQTD